MLTSHSFLAWHVIIAAMASVEPYCLVSTFSMIAQALFHRHAEIAPPTCATPCKGSKHPKNKEGDTVGNLGIRNELLDNWIYN